MNEATFMRLASQAAAYSRCNKKQLGCLLVCENNEMIMGTNGPPVPLDKCAPCPRTACHSATNLHQCRAVHAERQALLTAARAGISTDGAVLYSHMGVPCKDCLLELIQAGISEIVCARGTLYDSLSEAILLEWADSGGVFRVIKED